MKQLNELKILDNVNIRYIEHNKETYYALGDVLDAMGSQTNVSDAKERLIYIFDIKENNSEELYRIQPLKDKNGKSQKTLFIKEYAVTFLISQSRTEVGRMMLAKWYKEILPSLKKQTLLMNGRPYIPSVVKEFKAFLTIGKALGYRGDELGSMVNQATLSLTGVDVLSYLQPAVNVEKIENNPLNILNTENKTPVVLSDLQIAINNVQLDDFVHEPHLPSFLGKLVGLTSFKFNKLLESNGLQYKQGKEWIPTEKGLDYSKYVEFRKHGNEFIIRELAWYKTVFDVLKA